MSASEAPALGCAGVWWAVLDLNQRCADYESAALDQTKLTALGTRFFHLRRIATRWRSENPASLRSLRSLPASDQARDDSHEVFTTAWTESSSAHESSG